MIRIALILHRNPVQSAGDARLVGGLGGEVALRAGAINSTLSVAVCLPPASIVILIRCAEHHPRAAFFGDFLGGARKLPQRSDRNCQQLEVL